MASHNLAKIKIEDLEIIGYSVAGEETVIGIPQLDVCFDIGKAPDQVISINNVLLTHGHMDHSAGIAYYLSHRKFCGQRPGRVFAPENMILPIREVIDAWGRLDGNKIPAELIGMVAGDEYQIKPNLIIRAFATRHCRGSLGFCVLEKKKKLKDEYAGLSGEEIVALKKKNITIDYPVEVPIVTYLGDTQYSNFGKIDFVAKSKILIAECTFIDDEHIERALAGAHMYMGEFLRMLDELDNQYIVITHLSQRTGIVEAKRILKEKLNDRLYGKVMLLMDRKNPFRQEQQRPAVNEPSGPSGANKAQQPFDSQEPL
jgi:ribonuclease Z